MTTKKKTVARVDRSKVTPRPRATASALRVPRALMGMLRELAELSDESIDAGDPALFGSFRDDARGFVKRYDI